MRKTNITAKTICAIFGAKKHFQTQMCIIRNELAVHHCRCMSAKQMGGYSFACTHHGHYYIWFPKYKIATAIGSWVSGYQLGA